MANRIEVIQARSKYSAEPHAVLAIDGLPLDVALDAVHPGRNVLGLVPTMLNCLSDPTERELVWRRILPSIGSTEIAPVLMCPDDADLRCTIVVAEVEADESVVWWHRIGFDTTETRGIHADSVGGTVEWFDQIGPFRFDRMEYEQSLAAFVE